MTAAIDENHRTIAAYKKKIPPKVYGFLERKKLAELRPAQWKSIDKGLFEDKNLLVCTPTASGKTLVAELAILNAIYHDQGMCIYIVPLKALASEKYRQFKEWHNPPELVSGSSEGAKGPAKQQGVFPGFKIALTSGDVDTDD